MLRNRERGWTQRQRIMDTPRNSFARSAVDAPTLLRGLIREGYEQCLQRDCSRSWVRVGVSFRRRSDGKRRGAVDNVFYDYVHAADEHGNGGPGRAGNQ